MNGSNYKYVCTVVIEFPESWTKSRYMTMGPIFITFVEYIWRNQSIVIASASLCIINILVKHIIYKYIT